MVARARVCCFCCSSTACVLDEITAHCALIPRDLSSPCRSWWLFIIPSLRARRPRGWEKLALDIAFLGSPLITIAVPFVIKDPSVIWSANCAFFVASYAYGYAVGRGEGAVATGGFSGFLRWLDFGSGQERGVRGEARERFFEQQKKQPGEKDD